MTAAATPPIALPAPPATATVASRGPVPIIFCLAIAWCLALLGLVLTAANPIVVNPVQILHADDVVQGQWIPGQPPQVDVQRVWKGSLPTGRQSVSGQLPEQHIVGEVIVPLLRSRNGTLVVSGGELANPARDPQSNLLPARSTVRPLVYPATDDVLRQLRDLVGEPAAMPAP
ncbi:MAG TPA: hypothetical protein VM165_13985 [Planctomycetaceae bacterium]|nr:hypothetical protein [Planctomycetaceae bacterium]